ncbi:MAG: hypothetical protein RIQ60_2568 [Pseudomonadota bacterium]|jgi:type IV pilus assembly protein PilY1
MKTYPLPLPRPTVLHLAILSLLGLVGPSAQAALADISAVPLGTAVTTAKPNVMFILDDSGSMSRAYMPDEMSGTGTYGYYSVQCNGLAYDPNHTYDLPVRADGTSFPNATYPLAKDDGYATTSTTTDLSQAASNFYYVYNTSVGSNPALSWTYLPTGTLVQNSFYTECNTARTTASTLFDLKRITDAGVTASQQTNYAIWWSYYRKRYMLMRAAVGLAFNKLDDAYRVGFTTINDTTVNAGNGSFLDTVDFDATQRGKFYSRLYAASPGNSTPLRGALSKVGSYFGFKASGQTFDPASYATGDGKTAKYVCQRNYALLSTDGYWNNGGNNVSTTYATGFKLDGTTAVGEQDGTADRPMRDGKGTTTLNRTYTTARVDLVAGSTPVTQRQNFTRTQSYTQRNACAGGTNWRANVQTGFRDVTFTLSGNYNVTYQQTEVAQVVNGIELPKAITVNYTVTGTPTLVGSTTLGTINNANGTITWNTATNGPTQCVPTGQQPSPTAPTAAQLTTSVDTPGQLTLGATITAGTAGTPTSSDSAVTTLAGDSNTLADVAMYYYMTDLRPDIAVKGVKPLGRDTATWQHMTTYTVGLGVRGTLAYTKEYLTQPDKSDFAGLIAGSKTWPVPSLIAGRGSEDATHVDDLWHAAVNGRGQYFSAGNASQLSTAIVSTLKDVQNAQGTAGGAAASALTPTPSDNWLFLSRYATKPSWNGDLRAYKFGFNASTGSVINPNTAPPPQGDTPVFTVQSALDSRDYTTRKILFNSATGLAPFTYANLSATQKAYFDNRCTSNTPVLSQCTALTANASSAVLLAKVTGSNMVDFLRGDTSLQLNSDVILDRIWRERASRLGDITHASPVFVAKPGFKYNDAGYSAYAADKAGRDKVVYVGANDGMLHAFMVEPAAGTVGAKQGDELWAFVPTPLIPELWRLADSTYDDRHRYYVDATPVVADVYDGSNWRTILVGGLGAGGRGLYALDVTDTAKAPLLLWEFTSDNDANLGLTFGTPVVTKNKTGQWVVAFSSGYNNVSPGDGVGRLYLLDAITGKPLADTPITTGVGDTGTPSNLGPLNAWVVKDTDNTALRYYAGDMLGNLWRFDADQLLPPNTGKPDAVLLGQAVTPTGNIPQPITSRPLLSEIIVGNNSVALISFGTGRFLGDSDITSNDVQTIYTVKDAKTDTGLGTLRNPAANLMSITLPDNRAATSVPSMDWSGSNGWYMDLKNASSDRERVYLQGTPVAPGVIGFASLIPNGDPCSASGTSWFYEFGLSAGSLLQSTFYNSPVTDVGRVNSVDGTKAKITTQEGLGTAPPGIGSPPGANPVTRRTSWRELQD